MSRKVQRCEDRHCTLCGRVKRPRAFQSVPALMPATFYIKQYHPLICWHISHPSDLKRHTVCRVLKFGLDTLSLRPVCQNSCLLPHSWMDKRRTEWSVCSCVKVCTCSRRQVCVRAHTYCTCFVYLFKGVCVCEESIFGKGWTAKAIFVMWSH